MEQFTLRMMCFAVLLFSQGVQGWSIMTSRLAEIPDIAVLDIRNVVEKDIDYLYTAEEKGITAIKSKKHQACFVVEYDPYWNPMDDDLGQLKAMQPPMKFEGSKKFNKLTTLGGDVIAHMCSKVDVYWFAFLGPPPLPGQVPGAIGNPLPPLRPIPVDVQQPPQIIQEPLQPAQQFTSNQQYNNRNMVPKKGNEGPVNPGLKNSVDELIEPPVLNYGPVSNSGSDGLQEPPLKTGDGNLLEPPVLNHGHSDLLGPPAIKPWHGDLIEPPVLNPDLIEPPVLNPDLIEPPVLNPDLIEPPVLNPGLIEPPVLNPDLIEPPIKTPPPLAELLGMKRDVKEPPFLKDAPPLLKDAPPFLKDAPPPPPPVEDEQIPVELRRLGLVIPVRKDAQDPTLAPPGPDFNTPPAPNFDTPPMSVGK